MGNVIPRKLLLRMGLPSMVESRGEPIYFEKPKSCLKETTTYFKETTTMQYLLKNLQHNTFYVDIKTRFQ